jgi:L-alanine-DL-glutamate epimerase-like enolase superfamily enzyme
MESAPTELVAFRDFLDGQIASGRTDLTPEESLDLWRESLAQSVAAVNKALADLRAGETGQPLREFIAEFRAQNQIPADA